MNDIAVLQESALPASAGELSPQELEALNKFIGAGSSDEGNMLPRLSINYDAEYVDDNDAEAEPIPLKRGHYKITVPVEVDGVTKRVTAFAKTAAFRAMYITYRYSVYDSEDNKYVLNTTQFKEWGEVVIDDRGGEFKANTYKNKATKAYPEWAGDIKCIRTTYGTVSMADAKDMHGNPVEVQDVPCMWISKGASFMPVGDILDATKKQGSSPIYHTLNLDTKREKNGGTTYFIVVPELAKEPAPVDKAVLELVNSFAQTVEAENEQVIAAYKKVRKAAKDDDLASQVSGADLSDDFNDSVEDL